MVGDRRLQPHEVRIFLTERTQEFDALATLRNIWLQEGEPTLHDIAILELLAIIETQREFIVTHTTKINFLITAYRDLLKEMKILNEILQALQFQVKSE